MLRTRLVGALIAAVAAFAGVAGFAGQAAAGQSGAGSAPVVLVGISGLRWEDVTPRDTPYLWQRSDTAALANMTVRSVSRYTCPVDGWLMVNTGRRAQAPRPQRSPAEAQVPACSPVPEPDAGTGGGATIPGWQSYRAALADQSYDAVLGTLARAATGLTTAAIGPGAALALADAAGRVPDYRPAGSALTDAQWRAADLVVLALDGIAEPGLLTDPADPPATEEERARLRRQQARAADTQLRRALANLPDSATLLIAGTSDSSTQPHLEIATAGGPAFDDGWLTARSTRRTGLVQLTDVTPTLLAALGVPEPDALIGARWTSTAERPPTAAAVDELRAADTATQVVGDLVPPFFLLLVVSQVVLYGLAAVALRREWGGPATRLRVLRATRRTALVFAAVPISTFLANLVPWWRWDHPLPALMVAMAAALAAISLVAQYGPWRQRMLGPFGAVAAITAIVLGADIVAGAALQQSSLMGYSPLVAGRFYGFGNQAFTLFATGAVLGAAGFAEPLVRAGKRGAAAALVIATGAAALIVDGAPPWGADFGGVIAIVPAFAVLTLGVAGMRVTWRRMLLALIGGVVAIAAIAALDWLRPPAERTHLGRFVQQVIDGEAVDVVTRKLGANLGTFSNYRLSLLVPVAFAFVVLVLMRPMDWRAAALDRAYDRAPTLRPGVAATLVVLIVGFAVNDSGVAIPAVGLTLAIPLILAAAVAALERDELEAQDEQFPRASQPESGAART